MGGLERAGQLGAAYLDAGASGRPPGGQRGVDADDLADRALAGVVALADLEPHAEGVGEVPLERGVVGLGRGDGRGEHEPPVDGQPPTGGAGLDLVGDGDVGVQVGVAGAAVAVGERGGDQAPGLDLPDAVGSLAGEQGRALEERQRVPDRRVVGQFDRGRGRSVGDGP